MQYLFEDLLGQAPGCGFGGYLIADCVEFAEGLAAEAVVVAGREDDSDLLLVALDEDGFALRGFEESGHLGVGITCGVAHGKTCGESVENAGPG